MESKKLKELYEEEQKKSLNGIMQEDWKIYDKEDGNEKMKEFADQDGF